MPFVRPDAQAVLDAVAANPAPPIEQGDPATARGMFRQMVTALEAPARAMRRSDVTIPAPHGAVAARLYHPDAQRGPAPILVYYHGGGFVIGDLDSYDPLCSEIAFGLGMTLMSIEYRLAPEHPFPAAVEDGLAATRWAAGSPPEIGHPVGGLVLAGDSAGGNLAAVCARELRHELPLLAQWLIYPSTNAADQSGSMAEFGEGCLLTGEAIDWFGRHWLGSSRRTCQYHPQASPLLAAEWDGLPPAVVLTCGLDPLRDQGRAYAAKLIEHGIDTVYQEASGQIHGCLTMRRAVPSAARELDRSLAALKLLIGEQLECRASQA